MPGKRTIRKKKQLSWEAVGHSLRSRTAQCVYVILAGAVILCILVHGRPSRPSGMT